MHNDDEPIGRLLTRREMIKLLATLGATTAVAACAPNLAGNAAPATTGPSGAATIAPTAATGALPTATTAAATSAVTRTSEPAVIVATVPVPTCVVRPEQTEGPYFVDTQLNRSDIRSDPADGSVRAGALLSLAFLVTRIGDTCVPLPGAVVDVWHCDADGVYSGVSDDNFGSTAGQQFLRGYQVTDGSGAAAFTTIYPG